MLGNKAEALTGYATAQDHTPVKSVTTEVDALSPPRSPARTPPRTQLHWPTQKPPCSEFPKADLLQYLPHCMSPSLPPATPHPPLLHIPHQSVPGLPSRHTTDNELAAKRSCDRRPRLTSGAPSEACQNHRLSTPRGGPSDCGFQNNFTGGRQGRGPSHQNTDHHRAFVIKTV